MRNIGIGVVQAPDATPDIDFYGFAAYLRIPAMHRRSDYVRLSVSRNASTAFFRATLQAMYVRPNASQAVTTQNAAALDSSTKCAAKAKRATHPDKPRVTRIRKRS
jgi:hypothetical protein